MTGPLAMVQAVFARGELVAFHACQRVREGAAGGSSHKLGLDLPEAREHMAGLGAALGWHGALSADVIIGPDGPRFIDINPRLVEPVNALASGVDLAGALVEVARSGSIQPQPAAAPGARTHQLLLAVPMCHSSCARRLTSTSTTRTAGSCRCASSQAASTSTSDRVFIMGSPTIERGHRGAG